MTVNDWFKTWMESDGKVLTDNTLRNRNDRFRLNIRPIIGTLPLGKVKPVHCQKIINDMIAGGYSVSTAAMAYTVMGTMFKAAVANGLIARHPLSTVKLPKAAMTKKDVVFLTKDEENSLLDTIKEHQHREQYEFILQTGLRIGEVIALTFDNIDWDRHTLTINKNMEYRYSKREWTAGSPKTLKSYRTIPLTDRAYDILKKEYDNKECRKESGKLCILEYTDKRTGRKMRFDMHDLVFLNYRTGMPTKTSSYDTYLNKITEEAGIKHISVHTLRHTYRTRAVEKGVNPKYLQILLGHERIQTTLDTYVHVSDESLFAAVKVFQAG